LDAQEKIVRGSLRLNEARLSKLLAAMQRMGRNPPPVMVTRREDALEMVRSAMLLASVFPEMREQALYLSEKLGQMAQVMGEHRKQSEQLKAETARLADARTRLDTLLTQKKENLHERQGELKQVRQAAAELARGVTDLNDLIGKIDKAVSDQAGIAEYDRELAASRGASEPVREAARGLATSTGQPPQISVAPASGPPQPLDGAPAPAPPPAVAAREPEVRTKAGDRMAEKAPDKGAEKGPGDRAAEQKLALLIPKPMKPTVPFDQMKGALALPAAGKRVVGFGERTELGATSKGIVLETRANARITSPSDGWIVYAGEFRSYGQLLIINGGGGYHVVLAGLTRIDVSVGQFVLAGEPVGAMGTSGPADQRPPSRSSSGKTQDAPPVLYIEFRKDGRPFDPSQWWAPEGSRKV